MTIAIAIAAFALSIVNAIVAIWRWRRRRAAADCKRTRKLLRQLNNGGLMVKGLGAFNVKGHETRRKLTENLGLISDGQLRKILTSLLEHYDAAEEAAMDSSEANVLNMAAIKFDSNHPATRAESDIASAFSRLGTLERRAAGL